MSKVKLAVIYYSSTGTNYQLAQWASESANQHGAEVRVVRAGELAPESAIASNPTWKKHIDMTKHIPIATTDDIDWADAIIFSCPTRYGNLPAQMKQLIDSSGQLWLKGKLTNKVVSAMASAMNPHGGQEETILALYTSMYHWGAIVAAPGYTDQSSYTAGGNPYGTTVTVDEKATMREDVKKAVFYQAKRTLQIAALITGKTLEVQGSAAQSR